MRRCVDVQICRCANVQMYKCADLQMCRCADLVLVKELNELKTKVKQLEEEIQRQAQMPSIQFPLIRMPIRLILDIINSDPSTTSSPAVGLGIAKKEIQANKRKKTTK